MDGIIDRQALLRASAVIDLLDAGWQPGQAELAAARYLDHWAIVPSREGIPFRMIGLAGQPAAKRDLVIAGLLAFDRAAGWALIWDEWVRIGQPIDNLSVDAESVRRAGATWLLSELQRHPALA